MFVRLSKALAALAMGTALLACGTEQSSEPKADAGTPDAGTKVQCDDAPTDGGTVADRCQGQADLDWLALKVDGTKTGREVARSEASNCGLSCLNDPCPGTCAVKCMTEQRGIKLSAGCASCYGGIVLCTIENCLPQCINDSQAPGCKSCQDSFDCNTRFYACTGKLPD